MTIKLRTDSYQWLNVFIFMRLNLVNEFENHTWFKVYHEKLIKIDNTNSLKVLSSIPIMKTWTSVLGNISLAHEMEIRHLYFQFSWLKVSRIQLVLARTGIKVLTWIKIHIWTYSTREKQSLTLFAIPNWYYCYKLKKN
jgi:hypothetical protein